MNEETEEHRQKNSNVLFFRSIVHSKQTGVKYLRIQDFQIADLDLPSLEHEEETMDGRSDRRDEVLAKDAQLPLPNQTE